MHLSILSFIGCAVLFLSGCATGIKPNLPPPNVKLNPQPLQISEDGRQAWNLLKGHYHVEDSDWQRKNIMTITDLIVYELNGKPAIYMFDSTRNSGGIFQAADCRHSSTSTPNKKSAETLNCYGADRTNYNMYISRVIKKPVLPKSKTGTISLITGRSGDSNTSINFNNATHFASIQYFYEDLPTILALRKINDSTALDLYKPQ